MTAPLFVATWYSLAALAMAGIGAARRAALAALVKNPLFFARARC